jgi:hypothetical protein
MAIYSLQYSNQYSSGLLMYSLYLPSRRPLLIRMNRRRREKEIRAENSISMNNDNMLKHLEHQRLVHHHHHHQQQERHTIMNLRKHANILIFLLLEMNFRQEAMTLRKNINDYV